MIYIVHGRTPPAPTRPDPSHRPSESASTAVNFPADIYDHPKLIPETREAQAPKQAGTTLYSFRNVCVSVPRSIDVKWLARLLWCLRKAEDVFMALTCFYYDWN